MRAYGREVVVLSDLLDEIGRAESATGAAAVGRLPVLVISATEPAEGETPATRVSLDTMHRELAARSATASHATVTGADHLSLITHADHARAVAVIIAGLLNDLTDRDAPQPSS